MRWLLHRSWLGLVALLCVSLPVAAAPPGDAAVDTGPRADQEHLLPLPLILRSLPLLNDLVPSIEPAAASADGGFDTPLDATPDADGSDIYFTAAGSQGAGVFRVPAAGGEVVPLWTGAPLSMPMGLTISGDDRTLYIADSGGIFSLPASGGSPVAVSGTENTAPQGIEAIQEGGAEFLYFTGAIPGSGAPAVMKVAAGGGLISILFQGAPLVEPGGVAVSQDGIVYVADRAASGGGLGSVFHIENGGIATVAGHFRAGSPAGIALTLDESLLLVSSLHIDQDSSQVLVVNLAGGYEGIVDKVVSANGGSGGLHRARQSNILAWCGVTRPGGTEGTVYRIGL